MVFLLAAIMYLKTDSHPVPVSLGFCSGLKLTEEQSTSIPMFLLS